jgi:hypothetical protein
MELRQLSTESERLLFAKSLKEIRMIKGAGFCETQRSHVGEVHLAFGRLYAFYDEQSPAPGEMLGGFVLHDLGSFSQSYPKPDLTHLPPESVFECGELWAKPAGAARLIRQAAWILLGQLEAKAVLIYPIFKPWNLTLAYKPAFECAGDPIIWPYARTVEGGNILVQAMVSEGEQFRQLIEDASRYGFEASKELDLIRFNSPFSVCTKRTEGKRRESPTQRHAA